jgi:hypothetical protein
MNHEDRNNSVKSYLEPLPPYQDLRQGLQAYPWPAAPGAILLRDVLWRIKNPIPETGRSGASHSLHLTLL